ncbi:hypothetical protein ACPESL_06115 [Psychrobacter pocilloporae]|jgi:hypothetical protein|uniref:hypothetical protein n=1 Tax=Psychrobacter pocilloporae TaxID=1775882 RepID=UPI003C3005BA|tara:strand:+ start:80 stop:256 length:177 start_codon:yes stop_codon:yes gene_type:complete
MAHYAVYKTDTGEIVKTVEGPSWFIEEMPIGDDESVTPIDRQADDTREYIKDGALANK